MNYVLVLIATFVTVTLIAQVLAYAAHTKGKKVEVRKAR